MPDWLTKASKALSRTAPAEPVPFEIHCLCGGNLQGLRQAYSQEALCRSCGERFFILPLDVYPEPKPPKSSRKKSGQRKGRSASAATAKTIEDRGPSLKERLKQQAGQRLHDLRGKSAVLARRAVARQKAIFTPFRLVILLMGAVVVATAYWTLQSRAREQAEIALKTAAEKGFAALAEQDFFTAERQFQIAASALDALQQDDARARTIRQMLRESTAANHLATRSLVEILQEAQRSLPAGAAPMTPATQAALDAWTADFETVYGGEWIVIQAPLVRSTDAAGRERVMIDYALIIDGTEAVLEGEFSQFPRLSPAGEPKQAILAAQLDSCRLEDAGSAAPRWVIGLRPESTFLWSNRENCRALGFVADELTTEDEIQQILQEQSRVLGIEP